MSAWEFFDKFQLAQYNGNATDFDSDDLRIAIITATLTPNLATHEFWITLQPNEVAGTNYVAGGTALTSKALAFANAVLINGLLYDNVLQFSAANITWAQHAAGLTLGRWGILYKYNASASLARLIARKDFGGLKDNRAAALVLQLGVILNIPRVIPS